MTIASAKLEMSLADFQQLQTRMQDLERKNVELQKLADDVRLEAGGSEAGAFKDAFSLAMQIVRFAIANLDPLTVRGWPYETIREICLHLEARPAIDASARETVTDLRVFATECEKWERARRDGREQELLSLDNSAKPVAV